MLRAAALLAGVVLGCAPIVQGEVRPGLMELRAPIQKIAVTPFMPMGRLVSGRDEPDAVAPSLAATLVARHLTEALAARVAVVPAEDVARALGLEASSSKRLAPAETARLVAGEFGADAVLLGEVSRFVRREGEAAGTMRPAGVGFSITLYSAPEGRELWRARFDETQKPLMENLFVTARYPGAGTRWLTAEELTRWGTGEAALQLPLGP